MTAAGKTLDQLIEAAHRIGERAAREAVDADRNRRLSDGLVADMVAGGLIGILQPQRWGGLELGFPAFVRVARVLATYDIAASWVHVLLGIHHWWGALVEPEMQRELWADDPHRLFADVFAPVGRIEPAQDGVLLSGRWMFASGVHWSDFVALGANGPPQPGAEAEYLMCFVPKKDFRILDDWDTVGLRGTGSCSVEVADAFVPRHRIVHMGRIVASGQAPGQAINPGASYQPPFAAALSIALAPTNVGGAQGLLEGFRARTRERTPLFTRERQDALATSQVLLAESAVRLDACEQLMYRYADELMEYGDGRQRADPMPLRTRSFAWRAWIARESREVGEALFTHAGATAIYAGNPLQRRWRDLHAMAQHVVLNYEVGIRNYGRFLAGQELEPGIY